MTYAPHKETFKKLPDARAEHGRSGGILLIDGERFTVCHCTLVSKPCLCRSSEWIDSLAPTWDETVPENKSRMNINDPQQGRLF